MKILKFTLEGKTAFFKKPDVNTYLYFTYGNIHKVALLGIFGSILGLGGYNQMSMYNSRNPKEKKKYPDFYEKLKHIQLSIVPRSDKGLINKKVQSFNNSVGYASKEAGGNLIIKEQWLENPSWDIYIQVEDEISERLAEYILNKKTVFTPYLGKNDHVATIKDIHIYEENETKYIENPSTINSLFIKKDFNIEDIDEEDEDIDINPFKYEESLPLGLNEETNLYQFETFVFTNMIIKKINDVKAIKVKNKNLIFF